MPSFYRFWCCAFGVWKAFRVMYLDRSGSGAWSWLIDKLPRTPLTVILSTRFLTEVVLVDFWPRKKNKIM